MRKYQRILDQPHNELTIHGSSVPHILHWDISYLWVLEQQPAVRPEEWHERIRAWKHLVALFFLNKLTLYRKLIEPPLSQYTEPYGTTELTWAAAEGLQSPLGVLSPLVLIRPLPDFGAGNPDERNSWPPDPNKNPAEMEKLRPFVGLAVRYLRGTADQDMSRQVTQRLANILEFEFCSPDPSGAYGGRTVSCYFWKQIPWIPRKPASVQIHLSVAGERRIPLYKPRCRTCNEFLTQRDDYQPAAIGSGEVDFAVQCPNGHSNRIRLSDLMIWQRESEVVVWTDRTSPGVPSAAEIYPPRAHIEGNIVVFGWSPAELGGERERRFLKLRFGQSLVEVGFDDIKFRRLLVVGHPEAFQGLPIRPEYRDAVARHVRHGWQDQTIRYTLELRGWPFAFDYVQATFQAEPDLVVGLYPDFIPGWKRYRAFVVGRNHQSYCVWQRSGEQQTPRKMPWCLERAGWPDWVAVVKEDDSSVGATIDVPRSDVPFDTADNIVLGIDFGTTNSLVYCQSARDSESSQPEQHALKPSDFFDRAARILAGNKGAVSAMAAGWFLPPTEYRNLPDPYIVPSAFFDGDEFACIRWSPSKPFDNSIAIHGFKWDTPTENFQSARRKYLRELLFLTVPVAIKTRGQGRPPNRLSLGWSFPLAFGYGARSNMRLVLGELADGMRDEMGLQVDNYVINESEANVRGLFRFLQPGETFLVADMGGGTLDLALFTLKATLPLGRRDFDIHQVGSIRFAGEVFLRCLIQRMERNLERYYWCFRDSIQDPNQPALLRGENRARELLGQFVMIAFEFLRTMYLAHCRGSMPAVNLALVGNGWRLIEALTAETALASPADMLREYYDGFRSWMQLPELKLQLGNDPPEFRKHYVAQGALRNAKDQFGPLGELESAGARSKLPAGRDVEFSFNDNPVTIKWNDLVGEAKECRYDHAAAAMRGGRILMDMSSGPAKSDLWNRHWNEIFAPGLRPPDEGEMRQLLCDHVEGEPSACLRKGPLQLLMESWWLKCLAGRR